MKDKQSSKRRWIARFHIGRGVPATALVQFPDLSERLKPAHHSPTADFIFKGDASKPRNSNYHPSYFWPELAGSRF